jgi:hypothetical protein
MAYFGFLISGSILPGTPWPSFGRPLISGAERYKMIKQPDALQRRN